MTRREKEEKMVVARIQANEAKDFTLTKWNGKDIATFFLSAHVAPIQQEDFIDLVYGKRTNRYLVLAVTVVKNDLKIRALFKKAEGPENAVGS